MDSKAHRKHSLLKWAVLIVLLASAALTYYLMNNIAQFYVVDQQILKDSDFHETNRYWKQKRKNSQVITYSGDSITIDHPQRTSNEVSQRLSVNSPGYIRLSVEAGADGIVAENIYSAGGVAAVVFYGEGGSRLGHNNVVLLRGASAIRSYSEVVYVTDEVATVGFALRLLRSEGRFTVRNPELSIMAEFPKFKTVKTVLIAYWCIAAVGLMVWAFKKMSLKLLLWAGGLSVVVIVGVLMPGGFVTAVNNFLFALLPEGVAASFQRLLSFFFGVIGSTAPSASLSKFAHFLVFFLFGALVGQEFRRIGVIYGVALVLVSAIVTESLQTLVYGRSASMRDVYIDLVGGAIGLFFGIWLILALEKNRREMR